MMMTMKKMKMKQMTLILNKMKKLKQNKEKVEDNNNTTLLMHKNIQIMKIIKMELVVEVLKGNGQMKKESRDSKGQIKAEVGEEVIDSKTNNIIYLLEEILRTQDKGIHEEGNIEATNKIYLHNNNIQKCNLLILQVQFHLKELPSKSISSHMVIVVVIINKIGNNNNKTKLNLNSNKLVQVQEQFIQLTGSKEHLLQMKI